ncbi:MAG: leucine--tRNA ligase [Bacteroidota bacterium]
MKYNPAEIEQYWQRYWEDHRSFQATEDPSKPKAYILDMFPYPSGAGLHVGHPEGYTATDIVARYKRMRGFNVLHPIGWDAFGLPAERYAMQTNIHPRITTGENIATFRRQIKMLGLSYDWDREVDTTDPEYYRWTQWIFLKIYNSWYDPRVSRACPIESLIDELEKQGSADLPVGIRISAQEWRGMDEKQRQEILASYRLAYSAEIPVNWCEQLGTVLANEEVDEWVEKGYTVERRPMRQWMMRITAYAERLLKEADELDWPQSTVEQQRNWIGRSEGAEIDFPLEGLDHSLTVFTTRPDTVFGATFMVLAPEHPLALEITLPEHHPALAAYQQSAARKSDLDRGKGKEKSGFFTGRFARNPGTGKVIPVWIADYVLMGYGTGAIMAVPGQDERDWEFAEKFGLPIVRTVQPPNGFEGKAFLGDGPAVNSEFLNGLNVDGAKKKIIQWLESKQLGRTKVSYKLRDWLFSRQRYWGEPIPIIHWEDGTVSALSEDELPLILPDLAKFQPSGTTESPLAQTETWVNVVDKRTGKKGRRETNTMPQWAGSCWYYLRYLDPKNSKVFCDQEKEHRWMPVDLYIGGAEHAVLHLMYARFWHKVLYDYAYVSTKEPFTKLRHQGTILGEDSRKMSKSRGNVINPDVVVQEYGADSMRLFEMFMGPLEEMKPWSTRSVEGVYRFLNRVWRLFINEEGRIDDSMRGEQPTKEFERLFHQTVKKMGEDIESLRFNTAISQLMIFVNEAYKLERKPRPMMEQFILLLSPFAPHMSEEIWKRLGHASSLVYAPWPVYELAKTIESIVEIVFQVNGKVRSRMQVPAGTPEPELERLALADANMLRHLDGKKVIKKIVVKDRLVNLVVPGS